MTGFVIAVSGGIGSGKSLLAAALAESIDADHVGFGREVRRYAEENGENPNDRGILQKLGQALVLIECGRFVRRVLDQAPPHGKGRLIVDGVRHMETLIEIREQVRPRRVHLVHVLTPGYVRVQRVMERDGVERRLVARYDADITEAQVSRILPQYAECVVDGELPMAMQVAQVSKKIGEWSAMGAERPAAA